MKVYTTNEAATLQQFEQMFFNPVNGEAVMFMPKPEVDPDAPPAATRNFRDQDVYVGTGLYFEPAFQKLPALGENLDTSRKAQPIAPWNFATADTVNTVTDFIAPVLKKNHAEVGGVGLAKVNPEFPYVHADGSPLRSRELLITGQNGISIRVCVGQIAAMMAHSLYEVEKGRFAFSTGNVFADIERQLANIANATRSESGVLDVDMEAEVKSEAGE